MVRDPFPGNIIPPDRLNPVARSILQYYPLPSRDVSDGTANLDSRADQTGYAVMSSVKIDHRFADTISLSGLYITNKTSRTNENFWERGQGPNRFADPRDGTLDRRLHGDRADPHGGQFRLRSDPSAVRVHAPRAGHVPRDILIACPEALRRD